MFKSDSGAWVFNGNEMDEVWEYFWSNIVDLSFKGRCVMIYCVLFNKPPKCWWNATKKRLNYYEKKHNELEKQFKKGLKP